MEIVLAIDIGLKRCGLAKADPLGILISPLETVSKEKLSDKLIELQEIFEIQTVVVGLPENQQNSKTKELIIKEVEILQQNILKNSTIIWEDESYSSREAEEILKSKGISISAQNKSLIDSYAACVLLEQYFRRINPEQIY